MPDIVESSLLCHGNIMIVDDNPANLKLLEDMLLQNGCEVRSFPRGRLALAAAEEELPDLILLDVNMPEMNGYEVCQQFKSNPRLSDVPVMFLSALNSTEDKVKGFRAGGVDYISKPFQLEEVQARVETHLQLRRARQAVGRRVEALRQGLGFFLELMPEGTMIFTADGRIIAVNQRLCELTGYADSELVDSPASDLFTILPARSEYHGSTSFETKIKRKDGTTVTVGIMGRDAEFQHETLNILTVRDVSDGVAKVQLLTEQLNLTSTLLDAHRDLVLSTVGRTGGETDVLKTDPGTGSLSRKALEEILVRKLRQAANDDFVVLFLLLEGPLLRRRFGVWLTDQVLLLASQLIGNGLVGEELLGRWSEYAFVTVVKGDHGIRAVERHVRRICSKRIEHFVNRGPANEIMVVFTLEPRVFQAVNTPDELFRQLDSAVKNLTPESSED